jgi:hypothetical protein
MSHVTNQPPPPPVPTRPDDQPDYHRLVQVDRRIETIAARGDDPAAGVVSRDALLAFAARRVAKARADSGRWSARREPLAALMRALDRPDLAADADLRDRREALAELASMRMEGFLYGVLYHLEGGHRTPVQDAQRLRVIDGRAGRAYSGLGDERMSDVYARYVHPPSLAWVMVRQMQHILARHPGLYPRTEEAMVQLGAATWAEGFLYGAVFQMLGGHREA